MTYHPHRWRWLIIQAMKEWKQDNASHHAAALAYYSIFSLSPLLVILLFVISAFFGEEASRSYITSTIQYVIGPHAGTALEATLHSTSRAGTGSTATLLSAVVVLVGAIGIVGQLQYSLQAIVGRGYPLKRGWGTALKTYFISFLFVLLLGAWLVSSVIATSLVTTLNRSDTDFLPIWPAIWYAADLMVSVSTLIILFGLIMRYVPQRRLSWQPVWYGAATTAILFTLGRALITLYIGHTSTVSAYGAAGSLVALVLWVYYSSQIFLFGVELTKVLDRHHTHQRKHQVSSV